MGVVYGIPLAIPRLVYLVCGVPDWIVVRLNPSEKMPKLLRDAYETDTRRYRDTIEIPTHFEVHKLSIYMKRFLVILCAVIFVPLTIMAKPNKQTVILSCDLHCEGCCEKIMKNIAFEKGVKDLQCDLKNKEVLLVYDANKTNLTALLVAFEKIGKPATVKAILAPKDDASPHVDATTSATRLE